MKILKNILTSIIAVIIWGIISFFGCGLTLILLHAIFGPDGGGRTEVLRLLYAIGIAGLLTLVEIGLLFKWKHRVQAISVLIVSILFGGYYLLIIIALGGEYLFPEHHKKMANQRLELTRDNAGQTNQTTSP